MLSVLQGLPDSFEIYFQPFLNGDRPDVIIVKKEYGVLIIEVKDWNLNYYHVDDRAKWYLNKDGTKIKSPIDQVYTYKKNIFQLHIASYMEKQVFDAKFWGMVKCAVYFSEMDRDFIDQLVKKLHSDPKRQGFLLKNILIWDKEIHSKKIPSTFESLKKSNMGRFGEEEYKELTRYLRPTEFDYEQFFTTKPIKYTIKQEKLIVSEPRDQWIKGVVGSGKTTVLAARAAAAFNRVQKRILILTYNITLKNYIHDKISRVRGRFDPEKFYVIHYDQFIATEMNNLGLEYEIPDDFNQYSDQAKSEFFAQYHDDIDLFETVKEKIEKYPVILIDEVQDFKRAWLDIIKKYFLDTNGEYVLYSDEKQNIYSRSISNKDITTNVAQRPSALNESLRSAEKLKEAFIDYQQEFLEKKYNIDERDQFLTPQIGIAFNNEKISYYNLESNDVIKLFNRITTLLKSLNEHPKSAAIIGETIDFLRDFDLYYRVKTNEKTNAMFETAEVHMGVILGAIANENIFKGNPNNLKSMLTEAYKFFPEKMSMKTRHQKISAMLARILIEREVNEDRLYKSNAEQQEPLLSEPLVREWSDLFLNSYAQFVSTLPKKDSFVIYINKRFKDVRDGKKNNFWFHSGGVKVSTIQSFKGWEAGTLFLVVEPGFRSEASAVHELIYTSITRAKNNLVILNLGNQSFEKEFQPFFTRHIN